MVSNISSAENYLLSNTGVEQEELQTKLSKSTQTVTDSFENNAVGQVVSGNTKDPDAMRKTLLLLPPLMMADDLINKAIGGKGGNGLLGKVASVGDKISDVFHLGKVFSSENGKKVSSFIKNNRFLKYFTNDYKAIPKNSFAKSQSMTQKYSQEIADTIKNITKNPEFASLFKWGENGALSTESLNTIAKLDKSGAAKVSTKEIINVVDDFVSKGVDSVKKGFSGSTSLSELKNKLKTSDMKMGETGLGKAFAKSTLKTKDLFTFGGGLMGIAFAANALVQAGKAAKEAPKGEKKSTFMHVLSENYIGIALFSPSISLLYKAGGNKYRGMSIEGREALKELVTKTNANKALTKEGCKIAKLQKNLLLKGVSADKVAELGGKGLNEAKTLFNSLKNEGAKTAIWEKPLKAIGMILDTGLDSIKSPTKLGKIGGKLKGFTAGFGRFAIIMFLIQPFIQKPVTKLCHKIFGKPKTYLAKKEEENKKSEQSNKITNQSANNQNQTLLQDNNETNILKRLDMQEQPLQSQQTQQAQQAQQAQQVQQVQRVQPQVQVPDSKIENPQQINNEIPALNINNDKKAEKYIPRTDNVETNDQQNDEAAQQEVDKFINDNKKFKEKISKALNY